MSYRDRSKNTPRVRPVTHIELSEKNVAPRVIAIAVLLAIAVTALGVGMTRLLSVESGWQEIEASAGNINCSADFTLNYCLGTTELSPTAENKMINDLYTRATEDAYRIFSAEVREEGVYNVGYLNAHINETVTVDEHLYKALELIVSSGNRHAYLPAVNVEYNRVFVAGNEVDAARFDPARNPELMDYIGQAAAFAADPAMIDLKLLGGNQVCLEVSQEYLDFAADNGIDTFFDFGWMTNAFIADYIAGILTENGFTMGFLASYDGFTRNLDPVGQEYSFNLFDRIGNTVYLPGSMQYDGAMSIVYLRDYPLGDRDRWHYFDFQDGHVTTIFIDPADGVSKSATHNIVSYSKAAGCAEILMRTAPVFIADDFDAEALNALTEQEIYSVWCEDATICHNQPDLRLTMSQEQLDVTYSTAFAG